MKPIPSFFWYFRLTYQPAVFIPSSMNHNKEFTGADLLTSGQVAKRLGLTPDGIRAMARRGALKAIKTASGLRLFQRADIENLARRRAERNRE
jgi:excisionase family DNA binding protein